MANSCRATLLVLLPLTVLTAAAQQVASPGAARYTPGAKADEVRRLEQHAESLRAQLQQMLVAQGAAGVASTSTRKEDGTTSAAAAVGSVGAAVAPPPQLTETLLASNQLRLDLAVALQQLNHLRPDGCRRLPEAAQHYLWVWGGGVRERGRG